MTKRINVGCGHFPLNGPDWPDWINIDADPTTPADLHVHVPPMPFEANEVDEIYLGHVLEHVVPADANVLLGECYRVLKPGGTIGVVVPDTRAIMRVYLGLDRPKLCEMPAGRFWDMTDLDQACGVFLYSYIQPSPHLWSYDADTLARAITRAGFRGLEAIDRYREPRMQVTNWWSCGWFAHKPE